MKKIFTLLFVLSFGLLFSNTSKINEDKIVACPTATISYSGTPFCTNTTMPQNVFLTGTDAYTGGVFSSIPVGLAIDAMTGAITPSLSTPGTYTVTYTIPSGGGCPSVMATATATVQGSAQITPTSPFMNQTVCTFQPIINITAATTNATGATAFGLPPGVTLAWSSNTATIFGVPTNPGAYNYTIITTGGCSTANYSGTILVLPYSTATIGSNQTICSGNTATINFTGTANATVSYTINGGATQNIILNSSGFATLSTPPLTSNTVYNLVSVTSSSGCSNPSSGSATVTVNPSPVITTFHFPTICSGEISSINLTSSIPGTTYIWSVDEYNVFGASSGSGNSDPFVIEHYLHSYSGGYAAYTITPVLNGCMGTPQTVIVNVHPLPTPTIQDGYICVDGLTGNPISNYVLDTGLNNSDYTFSWYYDGNLIPGATSNYYSASDAGIYSVEAFNVVTGCLSPLIFATVSLSPSAAQSMATTETLDGNGNYTITVNVIGSGTYLYQLDGGNYETSNIFTDVPPGEHEIHVIDLDGCTDLTTTQTLSYDEFHSQNFVVSPNPVTDILNIKNNQIINKVTAFNQLGQIVLEKEYNNNEVQLDFSGLKTGIYFIAVDSDKKQSTFKIVKN